MSSNHDVEVAMPRQGVRRHSHRRIGAIAAALVVIAIAGCSSGAEPTDRQAATFRGVRVTVINNSSATVMVKQAEYFSHDPGDWERNFEDFAPVAPGERREYRADGGYLDGGEVTLFMTWDPLPATTRVNMLEFIAWNGGTASGSTGTAVVADPERSWWPSPEPGSWLFTSPEPYFGETINRYREHRIRLARQGWDTYFYNWEFIIET